MSWVRVKSYSWISMVWYNTNTTHKHKLSYVLQRLQQFSYLQEFPRTSLVFIVLQFSRIFLIPYVGPFILFAIRVILTIFKIKWSINFDFDGTPISTSSKFEIFDKVQLFQQRRPNSNWASMKVRLVCSFNDLSQTRLPLGKL